jgi:hypothetical protein
MGRVLGRAQTGQTGLSYVEVAVSMAVMAIVFLPLADVFYTGSTDNQSNREYGDAIAIADAQLASADSITYSNLGFYENQFGTPPLTIPGYNGQPAVDLGTAPAGGASAEVQPTSTPQRIGSTTFSETNYVVWVNGSGGDSYAYKQVYAVISWNEHGNTVSTTQSILVYPGGLGKYTGAENNTPQASSTTADNVDGLAASVPASPGGESEVNLSWTAPVDTVGFYEAVWAPDPGAQGVLAVPDTSGTGSGWAPTGTTTSGVVSGTASSFQVTGLNASTSYWFEIVAFSSDGSQWAISSQWVNATTLSPPPAPCTLNSITVSQAGQSAGSAQVAKSNSHLLSALTITVGYSGTCTAAADTVTVTGTSNGSSDPGSPYTLTFSSSPAQYTYSLCPFVGFSQTTHTYTALLNGTATANTTQVSFSKKNTTAQC